MKRDATINELSDSVIARDQAIEERNFTITDLKFKLPPPQIPKPDFQSRPVTSSHQWQNFLRKSSTVNRADGLPNTHVLPNVDSQSTPPQQQAPAAPVSPVYPHSVPHLNKPNVAQSSNVAPNATTANDNKPPFVKWTLSFDRNKSTLSNYLSYFCLHADLNEYSDSQKCQQLLKGFGMDALRLAQRLGTSYTFDTLLDVLYKYYEPKESKQAKQLKLNTITRNTNESARVQDLVSTCFNTISPTELDEMVIARFIQGHHQTAKANLLARPFQSIDEAVNHVDMLEASNVISPAVQKEKTPVGDKVSQSCRPTSKASHLASTLAKLVPTYAVDVNEEENEDSHIPELDAILDVYSISIDEDDDVTEDEALEFLATRVYKKFPRATNNRKCFYCGTQGHTWMKCYRLMAQLQKKGFKPSRDRNQRQPRQPQARFGTPYQKNNEERLDTKRPFNPRKPWDTKPHRRMPNKRVSTFFESMFDSVFAEDDIVEEEPDEEVDEKDKKDTPEDTKPALNC